MKPHKIIKRLEYVIYKTLAAIYDKRIDNAEKIYCTTDKTYLENYIQMNSKVCRQILVAK